MICILIFISDFMSSGNELILKVINVVFHTSILATSDGMSTDCFLNNIAFGNVLNRNLCFFSFGIFCSIDAQVSQSLYRRPLRAVGCIVGPAGATLHGESARVSAATRKNIEDVLENNPTKLRRLLAYPDDR